MAIRFYIAPVINTVPVGRKSAVVPYTLGIEGTATWSKFSAHLPWALSYVDAPDTVHADIQEDVDIRLIPFWDDEGNYLPLTATVSRISAENRTAISNFLESRNVPLDNIAGTLTIGALLQRVWRYLEMSKKLEDNFPNVELTARVSTLSTTQINRVRQWMTENGIQQNDITGNWTIRQVLMRIVRDYSWPPNEEFGLALL